MKLQLFLFVSLLCSMAYPQKSDLSEFFTTGKELFRAPGSFTSSDWLLTTGTIGITAASSLFDSTITQFAADNRSAFFDTFFKIDDIYVYGITAAAVSLYLYGAAGKNEKNRRVGLQLGESIVYSMAITTVFKISFGRTRPVATYNQYLFDPPSFNWNTTSFPSGHSSVAFASATVMASQYENTFWKIGWFTAATAVALGRVYNHEHWFSDVLMGSALGYVIGKFIVDKESTRTIEPVTPPPSMISFQFYF